MKTLQIVFPDGPGDIGEKLKFSIFDKGRSQSVEGNPSVEQHFISILMTDPGSCYFYPAMGGGLRKILQKPVADDTMQIRRHEIGRIIVKTEQQIIASQGGLDLPSAERLEKVEITRLEYNFDGNRWRIDVRLYMEDGNVQRVLLEPA